MCRLGLAFVVLLSVGVVPAASQPELQPQPNQVILFRHKNYGSAERVYYLSPGLRYKVVNSLGSFNDAASAIKIGKDVAVVVFQNSKLGGFYYKTFHFDVPRLSKVRKGNDDWDNSISSLMVIPRNLAFSWKEFGVFLLGQDQDIFGPGYFIQRFFPLPEHPLQQSARYPWVREDLNDKAESVFIGAKVKRIILFQDAGFKKQRLQLPGAIRLKSYNLSSYKFGGKVSSLIVEGHRPP